MSNTGSTKILDNGVKGALRPKTLGLNVYTVVELFSNIVNYLRVEASEV